MTTYTAFSTAETFAQAQGLADALERVEPDPIGIGNCEIEDGSERWEVAGYFTEKPDVAGLALLAAIHGTSQFVISKVEDRDWVAQVKRELTPVEAGRFVVYGSHDRETIPSHKIGLEIEAAMAFGTGHHGTTLGCLLALEELAQTGLVADRVADIGTGTGVLAMAAAKIWPCQAIASDIDPVATATAKANVRANGVAHRVRCITSVGFRHEELRRAAPYGLIFANILAGPLKKMAPDMARFTAPGGRLILSGILNRQARGVEAVYEGHGFRVMDRRRIGEWTTLVIQK